MAGFIQSWNPDQTTNSIQTEHRIKPNVPGTPGNGHVEVHQAEAQSRISLLKNGQGSEVMWSRPSPSAMITFNNNNINLVIEETFIIWL